jgi:hypothetical protein
MATDIERLTVLMEANTKQFANAMRRVERDVDKAFKGGSRGARGFDLSLGKAASSARMLAGAFGVGFLAGGFAQLPSVLRQITAEASKTVDVAAKVGLTTDALQEMRFAGDQTGVAVNQLDVAMQRFSRRIAEAAAGTGVLKDVLAANNIALRNQDGTIRPNIDLLGDYANLIKGAASEQDKLRLAFLAFDTEGASLVNTLRDGKDGLDGLRQSARDAAAVMDEKLLKAAKDVDDRFNALVATIGTKVKTAAITGITALDDYAQQMDGLGKAVKDLIESPSWRQFANVMFGKDRVGQVLGLGTVTSNAGAKGDKLAIGTGAKPGSGTVSPGKPDPEIEKRAKQIESVTKALEFEALQLGRTAQQQELYNSLRAAGTTLDTEAGSNIARLVGQIQAHEAALAQAAVMQQYFGQVAEDVFDRLVAGGEKLTDVLEDVVKQLVIAAAKAAIFGGGPFGSLLGGGVGGGGGTGLSSLLGSLFGGARAAGGPVEAGKAYLVGERGPELFRPETSGQIVPNGGDGAMTTVIQIEGLDRRKFFTGAVVEDLAHKLIGLQRRGGKVVLAT